MNAYELADAIEDWDSDGQWDTPAATMLRQQADRIAHLEMLVANRNEIIDKLDLTPQAKSLSDAIQIVEQLRVDADLNYKDYENTYADGWDDAFNEILSALYEKDGIEPQDRIG